MAADNGHLLLFFDRPKEPSFVAKGENKAAFNVPHDLLVSFKL